MNRGELVAGRYQIIEKIGQGGTGLIYKAYDHNLKKYVVVKKIKDDFIDSLNNRTEVDILKRLHHPYLPQVYDFVQVDRQIFTVMDFVSGKELKWYQDQGYVLDEKTIRKWLVQLLDVLEYLHNQTPKIIHGDIKPANIMVTDEGNICLIDFNISLGDGDLSVITGISEAYAAPEQIQKANLAKCGQVHQQILLDERTDLYSLAKSICRQMEFGRSRGYVYSEVLWKIISKAMAENPGNRYQSAAKMKDAVINMKKQDTDYRRYYMTSLAVHCGYFICILAAVLLIYTGYRTRGKEQYEEAYQQLNEYIASAQADEMIHQGIKILNMSQYSRVEKKNPSRAAEILHTVGDGYYLNEQFEEAADYYEQSIEKAGDAVPDAYYTDCGIAFAKSGQTTRAEEMRTEAESEYVSGTYIKMIDCEIALAKGDEEGALDSLENLAEKETDAQLKARAYLQIADIYEEQQQKAKALEYVAFAEKTDSSAGIKRRLGTLYHESGKNKEGAAQFKKLIDSGMAVYEDYINYAVCCESSGDYSVAVGDLIQMTEQYPEKYEAYMHLALSYNAQGKKTTAKQYYDKAKKYYEENGTQDSVMEELKDVLG